MKKLFMFLAVAGLATFGASCSSSDDNGGGEKKKDLVLSGKTDVKEGDAVTFTVKVGDKAETGTELYVDGVKAANPHTFSKVGEFKVQAKKNGFNDSNVLTVKVSEKGGVTPDPKTLVLSVSGGNEVKVGDEVIFLVKDNEGATVAGTVIKKDGTTVSNPWTPTEEGTFKFVASKEGYNASNELSIVVKKPAALGDNQISFDGKLHDVNIAVYELAVQTWNKGTENAFQGPALYNFPGGGYAYLYYVNVYDFDGTAIGNQGWVAVLVKNPTIVVEGNNVTNLGEMVYPGADANTRAANGGFVLDGQQVALANGSVSTFAVTQINFNEQGEGTSKFNLVADVEGKGLKLNFNGDSIRDVYVTDAEETATVQARGIKSSANKAAFANKALKLTVAKK